MNKNPWKARRSKKSKKRASPGNLCDLTSVLWNAIAKLEERLEQITAEGKEIDTGELTKLSHALCQAATPYLKCIEVGEFEARLAALEESYRLYEERRST